MKKGRQFCLPFYWSKYSQKSLVAFATNVARLRTGLVSARRSKRRETERYIISSYPVTKTKDDEA